MNKYGNNERVIITSELWEGIAGKLIGLEKTIIGMLFKIELDNGFSTLRKYSDFKLFQVATWGWWLFHKIATHNLLKTLDISKWLPRPYITIYR